jgi:hypothetical protein
MRTNGTKGKPDQCLADANIVQHLPPPARMLAALRCLYSGSCQNRGYRTDAEYPIVLSRQHHMKEARAPSKEQKKKQKPTTLSTVNSKLFFIFHQDLLCIVCTFNIFKYRQRLHNLDNDV